MFLALEEAKAEYTLYDFDIWYAKPDWFDTKINPLGKIPALSYGGPKTAPDQPAPESAKLGESLALVEFVADIFPESGLHPADPVVRARARMINHYFDTNFFPLFWDFFFQGKPEARVPFLEVVETVQGLLPETGYAVGDWSIADVAIAPFLVRTPMQLENDIGKQSTEGEQDVACSSRAAFRPHDEVHRGCEAVA
ncbi:hypothetical protein OH76DRAFT_1411885 [Lentinus brumalis]|uniref:GST N-terminal domain-containing protein n=1 Tax=Lentinus brumalis TaxID=2498619 RepID=A0A371CN16_9APHY|nr:hypothetical protein OH76DRAFT_1411885 [Polyporus brumalis]